MTKSEKLFERAVKRIPGGVNSPVRAYGSIGEAPRFIDRADGCYIYDVDGNRYIDYIDSWGPMILGHNFPAIRESVLKACENGLSFGCATGDGRVYLREDPSCGHDPYGQFRNRGRYECYPCCQRLYREK